MARESQRSSSSSSSASSIFKRGPFTRSTTSPPSLNRQNSHTARQECSTSPQGGATSLLFKVASASLRTSPRNSPPASPRQCPMDIQEVQWDVLSRRLSENRHGWLKLIHYTPLGAIEDINMATGLFRTACQLLASHPQEACPGITRHFPQLLQRQSVSKTGELRGHRRSDGSFELCSLERSEGHLDQCQMMIEEVYGA
ncbi:uncharacterized protein M437DRAFT_66769 [Aureobasidium melanogenum CBS 110374]|uniref:Uncharacterized protein n=1 Tax=Aureobasidium melanogenum (strain CBS 110374) TaxID=1043003 RepID=A0A074VVN8_AURM1|nr:uncharacterized protein M437DRAFT_66769 [Aureobasidium melanogenum CBS 110374]KEQ61797.1 hypothetical protein M437DRAFT_66769 [Aureobasidium melanogenum CBS 110374]